MENKNKSVLILNGSPRKNKNCSNIASHIQNVLLYKNIGSEILDIYNLDINHCVGCGFCSKKGYCCIKDDMTNIYKKIEDAKGIIVLSPVHFDCVSSKLKTLVDRTQSIHARKRALELSGAKSTKNRIGMYIAVGATPNYDTQFKGGQIVMNYFFDTIDTNLSYNLYLDNSDQIGYEENNNFKYLLDKSIEEFSNSI